MACYSGVAMQLRDLEKEMSDSVKTELDRVFWKHRSSHIQDEIIGGLKFAAVLSDIFELGTE
jgi:hypothetical protein